MTAHETQALWIVFLGTGAAVLGVVAGRLAATSTAATALEPELDALLRP